MGEVHTAHFRLDGEDFTRMVRDIFLSERPSQAWRTITQGLSGSSGIEKIAMDVLDGKVKFVGNETIGFTPTPDVEAEEYIEQIKYIYAGRLLKDNSWWRPCAQVTTYGPDDAKYAYDSGAAMHGECGRISPRWAMRRVEYYARAGERVFECIRDFIIFEPTSEPPFWWSAPVDQNQALEQFLAAGRHLRNEGWINWAALEPVGNKRTEKTSSPQEIQRTQQAIQARRNRKDEEDAQVEAEWKIHLSGIRAQVLKQAGDDFFELKYEGGSVMVPRAPFIHWALDRTAYSYLAPKWKCVSPQGLKLMNDDPYHSDWLIGAGLDVKDAYDNVVATAAHHELFLLQEQYGHFKCAVIVDGGEVTGTVGDDILVLADLKPDHFESMMKARAIITEAGGKMAHLAQLALERRLPRIVLVPDARVRYPEGVRVTISPMNGEVTIHAVSKVED